ncbi:hypothetical protein KO481_36180 [Nocardia sp. NEAU-G5]|uniref:Uncharacterized protein n=1 Tax=Nocardia albiluteola TaxID=2842303 RepID=A0ABS6B9H0_9NOCA|nr:hypothetical protein [Nocardia albiluteola]MBU3066948.1 hypothetical protein [Nocardia albiluteola]
MTNVLLALAVLDILLMTVLQFIYRLPPLRRRLETALVARRLWRSDWLAFRTGIQLVVLVLMCALLGLIALLL